MIDRLGRLILPLVMGCALTASAHPPGRVTINIAIASDGAHAQFALDRNVEIFNFADADVVRDGVVDVVTPGLSLKNDAVVGSRPFRRFEIRVRPQLREFDAKYPAFTRIGDGGAVYLPVFNPDPARWQARIRTTLRKGQVGTDGPSQGYFVAASAPYLVRHAGLAIYTEPTTPRWLVETSATELATAIDYFSRSLGIPLPRQPSIIITNADDGSGFVGDVTVGPVTALRFHGPNQTRTDALVGRIRPFVAHEAFHFWNGGIADYAPDTPSWLHEGGADYAALLAQRASGALTDDDLDQRLGSALERCQAALQKQGDKAMSQIGFLSNEVRYPCGMVIQWAVDLHVRKTSHGARDILSVWGDVVRGAAKTAERRYGLKPFYAAAAIDDPAEFAPITLINDQAGPERWQALSTALMAFGVDVRHAATPDTRRPTLVFHVLAANCKGLKNGDSYGFFWDGAVLKLQSPQGCGVLAGDPVIRSIEGGDAAFLSPETYAAVQRKCAAAMPVDFETSDGRHLLARCPSPLEPAPIGYTVKGWRPGVKG